MIVGAIALGSARRRRAAGEVSKRRPLAMASLLDGLPGCPGGGIKPYHPVRRWQRFDEQTQASSSSCCSSRYVSGTGV